MKSHKGFAEKKRSERLMIFEMIDASCELAEEKGSHPLERDCSCMVCVKQRKRLLVKQEKSWKFRV